MSDAIVAWSGWGETAWPADDEQRVVRRLGPELAEKLMPIVHQLEAEFFASDARVTAKDLGEMGDVAARRFRDLHAELNNDAVEALAWCYAFTYK